MAGSLPRVLLVSPLPPPYGGIARWTQTMVETPSDELGVHIDVVNIAHAQQRNDQTGTLVRLATGVTQIGRTLRGMAQSLRRGRPECIHVNSSGSLGLVRDVLVLTAARLTRVRTVLHLRFGRSPELLSVAAGGEARLLRAALRLATVTVAIDAPTYEAVAATVGSARTRCIPNFIHAERYARSQSVPRQKRVVFLGSVIQSKGVSELLDAWAAVRPQGWTLDLVGPVAPHYQHLIAPDAVPDGVVFHGAQEHPAAMGILARASLLVLPSHTEGFPNVVLEAMASGTPVLATAVGAIPDMLAGGAGRVVPISDVEALGLALQQLCSSAKLRESMARRASERVNAEYSTQAVFAQYRSVWLER